jgi:DNA-binding response OmpR family regulator
MSEKNAVLVVDDEEFIRDMLCDHLTDAGYDAVQAMDGEEAWEILEKEEHQFASILLDRDMPRLDGMALFERIKHDERFNTIPVILQTALDSADEVAEGIAAGVYYYLTKPFSKDVLLAILQNAVTKYNLDNEVKFTINRETMLMTNMVKTAEYHFKTLEEARLLVNRLSELNNDMPHIRLGLTELFINAVEHGNLGITYAEKTQFVRENSWAQEVERRGSLPEYVDKYVRVRFRRTESEVSFDIADQGDGFDWQKYLEISPERAFDPHGRGVAMSRMMSFDTLEYIGSGNRVIATKKL